jgi:DNA polymerase III alpha subunit
MSFVHLHTHSHYSIGRAVPRVRDLVERAAQLQMPALALTDNNSIAGMLELVESCDAFKIQPILGCELDILPSNHGSFQGRTHRITLLVENERGYRNLVTLLNHAHDHASDIPIHVSFDDFLRHSEGLIVLTGSPRSELYYWFREGRSSDVRDYLNRLAAGVGADRLYFEVMEYPHPRIREIMDYIVELSRFLNIPAVATQNVHFLDPEDMIAYCLLVQHPRQITPSWPLPEDELPTRHFTSLPEMQKRFGFTPQLLEQSLEIAERLFEDSATVLWEEAVRGATTRYGGLNERVKDRLNLEFTDIQGTGGEETNLAEYLLMLQHIHRYLREGDMCRGCGRGRLIASVIAYSLGIVDIDPLAFDLNYQPLREQANRYPLAHLDVSTQAMHEVLEFMKRHYGEETVVAVGKRIDWERQRLFHYLSRWAGLPAVSLRSFPPEKRRVVVATPQEHEPEEEESVPSEAEVARGEWDEEVEVSTGRRATGAPLFGDDRIPRGESVRQHQTIADAVYTLHPCPREFDAERAQYAVAKEPVETLTPVIRIASDQRVTQACADLIDALAMGRIQFATGPLLNVLEATQTLVRREENPDFSVADIPLNDEATFRLLMLGLTNGITPLHNINTKSLLRAERPDSIVALLRVLVRAMHRSDEAPQGEDVLEALPDAILGYRCSYLKVHHPVSFMAALLTHSLSARTAVAGQRPRFQILLRETRKMGIDVLGPHINFSDYEFSQEGRKVRTGLMAVQGMGPRTFKEISEVRHGMHFSSLTDFCQRTDPRRIPHPLVVNLIKSGAFDGLGGSRAELLIDFERLLKRARQQSPRSGSADEGQLQLFEPEMFDEPEMSEIAETTAQAPIQLSAREVMRLEQEAMGYTVSFDLLDHYEDLMRRMHAVSPFDLTPRHAGHVLYVAGFVDHVEREGPLIDHQTRMVLDLEGYVVKVPEAIADSATRIQNVRGPVLIEGKVERDRGGECFLMARSIGLLEDVARRADEVALLQIDLRNENTQTYRLLRSLFGTYKGSTRVEVEGEPPKLAWFFARGVVSAKVFFCPPLYQGLMRILSPAQVRIYDKAGRLLKG